MSQKLVGLRGFNLNAQLARYLEKYPFEPRSAHTTASLQSYHARPWRARDRLREQDIADIILAFKAGTSKHVLAKLYGINERSLKKLLREEGVKRRSWKDIQA